MSGTVSRLPWPRIVISYNTASELVSVSDPSSTIAYTRDNLGRATTIANSFSSSVANTTLTQIFDVVGNRTELLASNNGQLDFRNVYYYDRLRRMTDAIQFGQMGGRVVNPKHVSIGYNALSQRTQLARYQSTGTASPVATTDFTYDSANRLSGIAHKQGATNLNTYSYTFDPLSRFKTVTSTAEGTSTYSYDNASQLVGVVNSSGAPNESYSYDSNGNRNIIAGYTVDTNNRTMASPAGPSTPAYTYLYDDEGNMTRRVNSTTLQRTDYEWDHRNRLVAVSEINSVTFTAMSRLEYQYDAYNRLVSRYNVFGIGTPTRLFWAYDEGINPVAEYDISVPGVLTHRYVWSNEVDDLLLDDSVRVGSFGNTVWPLADHLGTARDIVDMNEATGVSSVANHRRYNSFGKRLSQTGTVDLIFGYTGKQFDEATGLQNNLNRWYDPNLGKWISQDPIGFGGGDANLYRYVGNGPTNATDTNGFQKTDADTVSESLTYTVVNSGTGQPYTVTIPNPNYRECSCESPPQPTNGRDPGSMRAPTYEEDEIRRARMYRRLLEREHSLNVVLEATGFELVGLRNELNTIWDSEFPEGRQYRNWSRLDFHSQRVASSVIGTIRPNLKLLGSDPAIPTQPLKRFAPISTAPQGHTRVYRAVSEGEYLDAMQSGQLRPKYGEMEGKWFSDSLKGAKLHGDALHGPGKYRIIEADVPNNPRTLYQHENMDGRGPARYIHCDDLGGVVPRNPGE